MMLVQKIAEIRHFVPLRKKIAFIAVIPVNVSRRDTLETT
jgi:hypothetical protein